MPETRKKGKAEVTDKKGKATAKGKKGKAGRQRKAKVSPQPPLPVEEEPLAETGLTADHVDALSPTEVAAALQERGLPFKGKASMLRRKLKEDLGAAVAEVKPHIESAPDPIFLEQERLRARIHLLISRGRTAEAEKLIGQMDEDIVGRMEILLPTGIAHHVAGDLPAAEEVFLEALKVDGDDLRVLENLEQLTFETQRFRESKRYIERLIANDPGLAEYWARRAIIHASERNFDLALQSAEKSLDRDPDNSEYRNLAGAYALMVGRHELARDHFARTLEVDDGFTAARRNLAILCSILGDDERAMAVAADLDDLSFATLATRALVVTRAGDALAAIETLEKSGSEDPRVAILIADIRVYAGDPDAALADLKELVETTDLDEAHLALARAYESKGWFLEALETLRGLPDPPETWMARLQDAENARELGERQSLDVAEVPDGRLRCPRCHSTLRKGADICKSCGYLVSMDEEAIACPRCGEELPGPEVPCPNCSKLSDNELVEARLRGIRGVGVAVARRLLDAFNDLDGIAKAKPSQLTAIKGVTKKLAVRIRKELK